MRHTFFGRGNPQEQVSLGRENYTQEHALSLGGGVTLFRGAVVLVIPQILIPSTANSKFSSLLLASKQRHRGVSGVHGWRVT